MKVATLTRQHEQLLEELLEHDHVEIERIAVAKELDAPPVREDGDTLIIPILEQVEVVSGDCC